MASERIRPHRHRYSGSEEIMQVVLERGEWIQVVVNTGTVPEPAYQIVQVMHTLDGKLNLRSNTPAIPWEEAPDA